MSPIKAAVTDNADPEDNGNFTLKTLLRHQALLFWYGFFQRKISKLRGFRVV
jgi:hypothetical protein